VKLLTASLSRLYAHKLLWLEEAFLLASALAGIYGWLLLPVATIWHLALHLLVTLAILSLLYFGVRLAWRRFAPFDWKRAISAPSFWMAMLLWLALGLWLPYKLVGWIPEFAGLAAQFASAVIRVALAGMLFTGGLLWLIACGARTPEE
jgi:hypothetical protein